MSVSALVGVQPKITPYVGAVAGEFGRHIRPFESHPESPAWLESKFRETVRPSGIERLSTSERLAVWQKLATKLKPFVADDVTDDEAKKLMGRMTVAQRKALKSVVVGK